MVVGSYFYMGTVSDCSGRDSLLFNHGRCYRRKEMNCKIVASPVPVGKTWFCETCKWFFNDRSPDRLPCVANESEEYDQDDTRLLEE